jgi:hypothetical protein
LGIIDNLLIMAGRLDPIRPWQDRGFTGDAEMPISFAFDSC